MWLIIGIGFIALLLGYLVAASSTSTVSTVVVAILALVTTAIGLITNSTLVSKLDALLAAPGSVGTAGLTDAVTSIKSQLTIIPTVTGIALTVFALFFFCGSYVGTSVRLQTFSWFQTSTFVSYPWDASLSKPSTDHAFAWLNIQSKLLAAGYNESQIQSLYSIQQREYKSNPASLSADDDRVNAALSNLTAQPQHDHSVYKIQ